MSGNTLTTNRVRFSIGPVPSDMAIAWVANARRLTEAVRNGVDLSIDVHEQLLDVIDFLLDIWDGCAARDDTFLWSTETDALQVLYLAREWLELGALRDDELERLGCTWAPEWTRPFADALVVGVTDALQAVGEEGEPLRARLNGDG